MSPDPAHPGLLLVIAGPSGVGKSTIVHGLMREFNAAFSVSATTRAPSPGERDGIDYFFIDRPTFSAGSTRIASSSMRRSSAGTGTARRAMRCSGSSTTDGS
jgi:nicotinamide riboside kinase